MKNVELYYDGDIIPKIGWVVALFKSGEYKITFDVKRIDSFIETVKYYKSIGSFVEWTTPSDKIVDIITNGELG